MQTIQFIETVQWIESLFSTDMITFLSGSRGIRGVKEEGYPFDLGEVPKFFPPEFLLKISHELARKQNDLESHPFASTVLQEFDLGFLLEGSFPVILAKFALGHDEKGADESMKNYAGLFSCWYIMTSCVKPIRNITTPAEILEEQDFDDILTVEVRPPSGTNPSVNTIAAILKLSNDIYLDVAKLMGAKDSGNLVGVYASSGPHFRFDFKGLGEPIKEIKNLLVELWQRIRHRESEDLVAKNMAIISSLKTLEKLKQKRDKKVIPDEDADKLAHKIFDASLKLFKKGGLIREIKTEEVVSNRKLIEAIQIKQLPPAANLPETKRKAKKKRSKKVKKETKALPAAPSEQPVDKPEDKPLS
ncbi:hypothetical protein ES703_35194 [subsurface metagenome]